MTEDQRLERIFRDVMDDDQLVLTEDTMAADVEGWDSLSHVTLMFSIEQEYGIQFLGEEFANLGNVGELRRMIDRKLGLTA